VALVKEEKKAGEAYFQYLCEVLKYYYPNGNCQETSKISMMPFVILIFFVMSDKPKRNVLKKPDYWYSGYRVGYTGLKKSCGLSL